MKKKIVSIFLTVAMVMTFATGCGAKAETAAVETEAAEVAAAEVESEAAETETAETETAEAGSIDGALSGVTLKVGTDTSFVPFCFPDESNEYVGFDIDMLKAFSEKLGFEYELSPMDFSALLMSVQSEKLDVGLAGITIKPERQEVMDFSTPYYDAGLLIFVNKENTDINSIEDLSGKVVAVKEGTASVDYVQEHVADVKELKVFPNIENAYLEVERGAADAVVYDAPNILYYLTINPESNGKAVGDMFDAAQYGIVFQKGSEYTELFNAALEEFEEDGTYQEIYDKWFGAN